MKRKTFALCDYEVDYANNFIEYFLRDDKIDFDVMVFYNTEDINNYLLNNKIDLMLITIGIFGELGDYSNVGQIVILSEGKIAKKYSEFPVIFKYQRTDKIISELLSYYALTIKEDSDYSPYTSKVQMIGVYSPVKRAQKTSFAIGLCQVLSESKRVLYINLEEYSGLNYIFSDNYRGDILDFLYFERQKSGNCILKLKSMVGKFGRFDYISPAKYTEELKSIAKEEWIDCLKKVKQESGYERIVIDFGECIGGLIDILDICSKVYMPIRTDFISMEKVRQFEEYIEGCGRNQLKEIIKKIVLPKIDSAFEYKAYFENLTKGNFREVIQDVIMEKDGYEV